MSKHVRVRLNLQAGALGGGRDDARDAGRGERAAALADENERGLGALLALEAPTSSQFIAQDGWGAVVPFLARRT